MIKSSNHHSLSGFPMHLSASPGRRAVSARSSFKNGHEVRIRRVFEQLWLPQTGTGRGPTREMNLGNPPSAGTMPSEFNAKTQRRRDATEVAQIFNLLYRGFVIRKPRPTPERTMIATVADCKSAIQQIENLRYGPLSRRSENLRARRRLGRMVVQRHSAADAATKDDVWNKTLRVAG